MATGTHPQISNDVIHGASEHENPDLRGSIIVLFTSTKRTLKALEEAGALAKNLGTRVAVVATETVPYTLPLDETSAPMQFVLNNFAEMAAQLPVQFSIVPYLCRSRLEALQRILPKNSPVVIGIRKGRWPTRDERLARQLRHAGYAAIPVEVE